MLKTAPTSKTVPSGHAVGVSNDEFRAALARLAAGVVLVTAHEEPYDPDDPRLRSARTWA